MSIVGIVLICLAVYFLLVRSRQGQVADLRLQVTAAENESVDLQAELQNLQALKENAPKAEARLAEIRELIPRDDQVANFIFQVQDSADRSGVGFVEIIPEQPKAPPEGAPVAQVRLTIAGEGDYFALQDFVRRLYDLDRALRVETLAIAKEDDPTKLPKLTVAARIFFEAPAGAAPATGTETTTPSTSTTTTTTSAPATAPAQPAS